MPQVRSIAAALRRGATIVAASPRAARALHLRFAQEQRSSGQTIWATPAVHDWGSWIRGLWRDHAFAAPGAPTLLTPLQERALWLRAQRDDAELVISPDSMAALAMQAWSLLCAFNAQAARRDAWEQTDAERFRHWATTFEQLCARNEWLSAAQLESALLPHLTDPDHLALPPEIVLIGFDRITPAQRNFLDAVARRDVAITLHQPELGFAPDQTRHSWVRTSVLRDEIAACAAWARDLLIANPGARIGVIAPDISSARGLIDRTFRRVLLPASEDIRQPSSTLPWEFSLGQPLDGVPAIRAALLLLRWTVAPLPEEHISWLMLSGFVADAVTNPLDLARHDARQRRLSVLTTERSLASYRDSLLRYASLRNLSFRLNALHRSADTSKLSTVARLPSAFADLVPRLLERAGWPGFRAGDSESPASSADGAQTRQSGDSVQFQALRRWQRLLDDLALLDLDNARISWRTFVDLLARQAQETIFAPESHDAPIQVMGPFESSGQQFDALWFLGTDDTAWPQRGRLHPLLPPAVQRQFEMPHFSQQDDWNLSHIATSRLLASAPVVVFSCAERDKDTELRPSPLIASLFPAQSEPDPVSVLGLPVQAALPGPGLETVVDDSGVLPWPVEQIAGGASVLRSQAACAFQAFASRRLRAEPLNESEWGIGPLEKGKLLHDVMQRLFSPARGENVTDTDTHQPVTLRSRDDIVTMIDTHQLNAIVGSHIDAAIAAHFDVSADPWQQECLAAEKRRLLARIRTWLELESRRQPFAVEACEQCLDDVHVGDLRLRLRADRIDLLPDASRLLLDYKTGIVSPSSWDGDRPTDPQLPLYAVYGNIENLSGVLFARIKAGKMNFEGSVRDARAQLSADIPAKKALVTDPYSDAKRDQWASALGALAQDFLTGDAAVRPEPGACKNCRLHSLCRIAEHELLPAALEDTTEEDADA